MNRTDLRGLAPEKMEKHIRDATANRMLIDASPDRMAALEAIMARANLVWAVWFENDRRKPKLLGHALAIVKGIPLMQRITESGSSGHIEVVSIMFDSHSSACGASALFGDDMDDEAAA